MMKVKILAALAALGLSAATLMALRANEAASTKATGGQSKPARVEIADAARLEKAIRAARGKVTLINFWATWCPPCVAEFPSLVQFYDRYKAKGMTLLAVSLDAEGDRATKVLPFLRQQKAAFPVFVKAKGGDEAFINAIDKDWEGSIPRTYLLDRKGNVRQVFAGEIEPKQVETTIRRLLAEKPNALPNPPARHPKGLLAPK
jgi:thiol-disulfide isomerase/thioredoxin